MKILFTGGGSGGHFYPIIAIAQEIRRISTEKKLVQPELFFMSTGPYDERMLFETGIKFIPVVAGKIRRDKNPLSLIKNFIDLFKMATGTIEAIIKIFKLYPDVIMSKGAYASFPAVLAGRLLRIPVVIHESDSRPGRVNLWSSKFAQRIAVSYPDALKYFPAEKTAITGNPLRQEILIPTPVGAHEYLRLDKELPIIFVVGGSQGAKHINDIVVDILPQLLIKYQIIHQVGEKNLADLRLRVNYILKDEPFKDRYQIFDYLDNTALRMTAGVASLVITRAGSTLFEIANWGLPSIIIPLSEEVSHDQRTNAFTYARSGGAVVIEEKNLTQSVLLSEIDRIMTDKKLQEDMRQGAKSFARPEAATIIADELLKISLRHEE